MRTVLIAAWLTALGGAGGAQELWRIGEFDNSYDEFACARNHNAFAGTFRQDPVFHLGTSVPKTDWCFVNPGPTDAWAGSRLHPFAIEFDLPEGPKTALRLVVDLVDVQGMVPMSMGVRVNDVEGVFRLKNGNEASIHDPAAGKEQVVSLLLAPSMLRAGANRITLWSLGSWFLYDAVSLSAEGSADMTPRVRSLSVEPTVFYKRLAGGGLAQVLNAKIEVEGAPDGLTLTARCGDAVVTTSAKATLSFGTLEQEILIPEVSAETPVVVEATLGDTTARAETALKPERKWRIFVAPSVHTDIGYTDLQDRVATLHGENTAQALALVERFPAFGWNLETAWQAEVYQECRSREDRERLFALAREGRVGIQASYLNMLTALCSHEELNRWLYYAASLKRKHGVPMESALITDVPTQAWSIPSTLAAAGIRYFATGINTTRGNTFTKLMTGHPYWWEGPDGSRVLAYFAPGYAHAVGPLSSVQELQGWILANTRHRADFPYDALFLYGAFGDNQPMQGNIAATAQQWADTYEFPKVIVGTNAEYFRYMEQTYGDQLPTVRGDGGHYWEDGAASSAYETAINRRAHETASAADALFAIANRLGAERPPKGPLSRLWRDILLYDEHTWGAWSSISDPDNPFSTGQWKIKAQFARDADKDSRALLDQGLARLGGLVASRTPALVLFNATGWERTDELAGAWLAAGKAPCDPRTGAVLPAVDTAPGSADPTHRVIFRAPTIPPWGYVVCPLTDTQLPGVEGIESTGPLTLENERLRLTVDPATGGLSSLIDKTTGRECVDQSAPYGLNEYLYVSGGDGTNIVDLGSNKPAELTVHRLTDVRFTKVEIPGLVAWVRVEGRCGETSRLVSQIVLRDGSDTMEVMNIVDRKPERKKEAAYFAFPFAATNPEVRLEVPNGVMRPEADQLPGGCKEWYAVQHFARVTGDEGTVAWASPDAPLVCVGDINRGLWPEKRDLKNGHLYAYVMNNYWFTNYKADQGETMTFCFAVKVGADSDAAAARFGWQAAMPVHTCIVGVQDGPLTQGSGSFCRVEPDSVVITAVKAPEVGSGLVVRLMSYAPKPVTARLKVDVPARSATLCNLVEEPLSGLSLDEGVVELRLKPMAPTTVLLR
jgi:hypothetical protein